MSPEVSWVLQALLIECCVVLGDRGELQRVGHAAGRGSGAESGQQTAAQPPVRELQGAPCSGSSHLWFLPLGTGSSRVRLQVYMVGGARYAMNIIKEPLLSTMSKSPVLVSANSQNLMMKLQRAKHNKIIHPSHTCITFFSDDL